MSCFGPHGTPRSPEGWWALFPPMLKPMLQTTHLNRGGIPAVESGEVEQLYHAMLRESTYTWSHMRTEKHAAVRGSQAASSVWAWTIRVCYISQPCADGRGDGPRGCEGLWREPSADVPFPRILGRPRACGGHPRSTEALRGASPHRGLRPHRRRTPRGAGGDGEHPQVAAGGMAGHRTERPDHR